MNRPNEMEAFVAVVEAGNFSSAARALHLTPSAVSKQMARLETRLQVQLIHRNTRQLRLTDAGRAYFDRCRTILDEIRQLETDLIEYNGQPQGVVRLSLSPGLAHTRVLPRLNELYSRHPGISVELHLSDEFVNVVRDDVDIALRLASLQDSSLVARKLTSQVRLICAAPSYLERHGSPETPDDLSRHNCLTVSVQGSLNRWDFVGPDGEYTLQVKGNLCASDMLCLFNAGVAGLGLVRLSNLISIDALLDGTLVPVLVPYTSNSTVPLYALTPSRRMSPKVRATVDFLAEVFDDMPDIHSVLTAEPPRY